MPPFVHLGVVRNWRFGVGLGRDDRRGAAVLERCAQGVVVERLVGDEGVEIDAEYQRVDADAVVTLAGKQDYGNLEKHVNAPDLGASRGR